MLRFAAGSLFVAILCCSPLPAENRDKLSPAKALIGHWVTESGATHYYFTDDKVIMVDNGKPREMTWKVLSEKDDELALEIQIKTETSGHDRTLRFTNGRASLLTSVSITFDGKKAYVNTIWKYVDGKTKP